jgi:hypothetical protein
MIRRHTACSILSSALVLVSTTWSHATDDMVFTIRRGTCFLLPDGAELSIHMVGHKRPMAGGPPGPLLIGVTFRKGTLVEEGQIQLRSNREDTPHEPWTWGEWHFLVLDFESIHSLTLRAWKRRTSRTGGQPARSGKN